MVEKQAKRLLLQQAGPSPKFQVTGQFARAAGSCCFCPLLEISERCSLWPPPNSPGIWPWQKSAHEPSDSWKKWTYCSKLLEGLATGKLVMLPTSSFNTYICFWNVPDFMVSIYIYVEQTGKNIDLFLCHPTFYSINYIVLYFYSLACFCHLLICPGRVRTRVRQGSPAQPWDFCTLWQHIQVGFILFKKCSL